MLVVVDMLLLLEEVFVSGDVVCDVMVQLFCQQLECVDVVVLNKIDGMEEVLLLQVEEIVCVLVLNVCFLELVYGVRLDICFVFGLCLYQVGSIVYYYYMLVGMLGECVIVVVDQWCFNGYVYFGLGVYSYGLFIYKYFYEQDFGW